MSGSVRLVAVVLALILLLGNPVLAQEAPPIPEASEDNETQPVPEPAPAESPPTPPDGVTEGTSGEDAGAVEDQYGGPSAPADEAGSHPATAVPPGEEEVPPLDSGDTGSCEQYGCDQYSGNVEAPPTGGSPEDLPDPNECNQYASCEQYRDPPASSTTPPNPCMVASECQFSPPPGFNCAYGFDQYLNQYVYECSAYIDAGQKECNTYLEDGYYYEDWYASECIAGHSVQECTTYLEDGYYYTSCLPSACLEQIYFDEQGNELGGTSVCSATAVAERAADDSAEVSYYLKQGRSTLIDSKSGDSRGSSITDRDDAPVANKTIAPAGRATSTEGGIGIGAGSAVVSDRIEMFEPDTSAREVDLTDNNGGEVNEDRDKEPGSQTRGWLARLMIVFPAKDVAGSEATDNAKAQDSATDPSPPHRAKNDQRPSPAFGMLPLASSIGVLALVGSVVFIRKRFV